MKREIVSELSITNTQEQLRLINEEIVIQSKVLSELLKEKENQKDTVDKLIATNKLTLDKQKEEYTNVFLKITSLELTKKDIEKLIEQLHNSEKLKLEEIDELNKKINSLNNSINIILTKFSYDNNAATSRSEKIKLQISELESKKTAVAKQTNNLLSALKETKEYVANSISMIDTELKEKEIELNSLNSKLDEINKKIIEKSNIVLPALHEVQEKEKELSEREENIKVIESRWMRLYSDNGIPLKLNK